MPCEELHKREGILPGRPRPASARWVMQALQATQDPLQAPELHTDQEYDAYLTDAFSLGLSVWSRDIAPFSGFCCGPSPFGPGVTLYAVLLKDIHGRSSVAAKVLKLQDYPWLSTRPGGCKCCEYVKKHGFRAWACPRRTVLVVSSTAPEDPCKAAFTCFMKVKGCDPL